MSSELDFPYARSVFDLAFGDFHLRIFSLLFFLCIQILKTGDIPDTINVYVNQTGDKDPSYYFWPDVGGSSIALIFHDIFLILLIAAIIYLVKNMAFCQNQESKAKQQFARVNDTVTDEVTV